MPQECVSEKGGSAMKILNKANLAGGKYAVRNHATFMKRPHLASLKISYVKHLSLIHPGALFLAAVLLVMLVPQASAHNYYSHRSITKAACELFAETDRELYYSFSACSGRSEEMERLWVSGGGTYSRVPGNALAQVIEEAGRVDYYRDVEFIDVWGGVDSYPHSDRWDEIDDEPHHTEEADWYHLWLEDIAGVSGMNFTAFNHFIDIRKGPGRYDDYDGYSYYSGSGSENWWGMDGIIRWWFNDEYVHAPWHAEYSECSSSIGRYHRGDRELVRDRFPMGDDDCIGRSDFMPVDNLVKFWYDQFVSTKDPAPIGAALHGIQDCSVPQHAAGFMGNWHPNYEKFCEDHMESWVTQRPFRDAVVALVNRWNRTDPVAPVSIRLGEEDREPAINWRVDQLATWLALKSYRVYEKGIFDYWWGTPASVLDEAWEADAEELAQLSTAMSVLVLMKAARSYQPPVIVSLNPSYVPSGYNSITVRGDYFMPDTRVEILPDIRIHETRIMNEQEISLMIFIPAGATIGPRNCTVRTANGEASARFSVAAAPPAVPVSVTPPSCPQGASADVVIGGSEFWEIESVEFGNGIRVERFRTIDRNAIAVSIVCAPDAETGLRSVTVRKRAADPATGPNLFRVTSAPFGSGPYVTTVDPGSAQQGDSLWVTFRGMRLGEVNRVDFGGGISVDEIRQVTTSTGRPPDMRIITRNDVVRAHIKIEPLASTGTRNVRIYTGSHYTTAVFRVTVRLF